MDGGEGERGGEHHNAAAATGSSRSRSAVAFFLSDASSRANNTQYVLFVGEAVRGRVRFQDDSEGKTSVLRDGRFAQKGTGRGICHRFQIEILDASKLQNYTFEFQFLNF